MLLPASEIERLARQFLAQLQAGEKPDREAVVRAHPQLGALLNHRLALVEMAYDLGLAPGSELTSVDETGGAPAFTPPVDSSQAATAGAGERALFRPFQPSNPPDYEIVGELGQGGMGVVYQANQKSLHRRVALKMLRAGAHANADLRARFHVEAETLASLQHPNIVQIYEVGEHQGCPFMAMEFVEGGALSHYLRGQPQPARAAAELVATLARAMHAAHQRGIVHRDLKPANILLATRSDKSGEPPARPTQRAWQQAIPKITDFGLAKRLAEGKGQTTSGAIMGTPSYMPPEQAGGRLHEIGPATDVYALGAILYELLTGAPPFREESVLATLRRVESEEPQAPSRLRRRLPRDLETICLKCLAKEPAKRYAAAQDLADDLRRFLDGEPIVARPARLGERAWKWVKRRPTLAALIGMSVAAALTLPIVAISWSLQVRAERDRARHNLQVARTAIDDLYTKMASERLFDEPQLDPLCQELLEKAQTLYEELAHEDSDDPDVRRDIALAWFRLGEIHGLREQRGPAEHAYDEAIARQEELCRADPAQPRYRQDLAASHNWLGELFRTSGRPPDQAERQYRTALELQQALVQEFPEEPTYRVELARSHYNLGIVEQDTNRLREAQADYDRAVEFLTELHKQNPKDVNGRQDLARALINRGKLHRSLGRPSDAEHDYDQAIDLLGQLRAELPARAAYKFEMAIARENRGNVFWEQHRLAEAQREHQEALRLVQGLVVDYSKRPRYKKKLANALKNLGSTLASAHDYTGARQCWDQARSLLEALVQEDPETADYHGLLGMTLGLLGWLRTEQKDLPAARRVLEQGITELQAALKSNPQHPDYRKEIREQYRDLAWTLVRQGNPAAAVEAAKHMADVFPEQAQYNYFAACFIARAVPLTKDEQRARQYLAQAVALLRKAADNAPPNLQRIPDEKQVFQPLTADPEFAATLRALEAKVRAGKTAK
jgi:tetratricopeptide (TPR) repeat protein/tRNA A-37 threonylcarbamoyl transferase component Bud32